MPWYTLKFYQHADPDLSVGKCIYELTFQAPDDKGAETLTHRQQWADGADFAALFGPTGKHLDIYERPHA